jgi:hypothetical protein
MGWRLFDIDNDQVRSGESALMVTTNEKIGAGGKMRRALTLPSLEKMVWYYLKEKHQKRRGDAIFVCIQVWGSAGFK